MTKRIPWRTWQTYLQARGARLRPRWDRMVSTGRAMMRPRSLSLQMAIVAVTIAVCAIIATAFISAIAVGRSFSSYTKNELQHDAQNEAYRISDLMKEYGYSLSHTVNTDLAFKFVTNAPNAGGQTWVISADSEPVWPLTQPNSTWAPPDYNNLVAALRNAITSGQSSQGDLPDPDQGWLHFSARSYAVVPIVSDPSVAGSSILGAIAISSDESVGSAGGPAFISTVDHAILVSGLLVAVVVAIIGALLAQRIAKPIRTLTKAASHMATGDLSTRVALAVENTPAEIAQLGTTFNEMAAKLEHDVDELRRQEQLQRELVANVAHELATPLTAISGYSELLADDETLSRSQRDNFTHIIHRETVRLSKLVYQLRQVARLESGAEKMDLQHVALQTLVGDTIAVLQAESERHAVQMHNAIPATLPDVLVDTDRLTQVVINLLDNAVRHTPMGGSVTIAAYQEGPRVWVTVTDSGKGIAPHDLPRVFDRFYRADLTHNSGTGGTGLGLAIVKGIVEAHGGQVRADNSPDGGARMSFSLQVAAAALIAIS